MLQLAVYYHMILFSPFTSNQDVWFFYGYSFIALVVGLMIVNIIIGAVSSITELRHKKKLGSLKEMYEIRIEEATKHTKGKHTEFILEAVDRENFLRNNAFAQHELYQRMAEERKEALKERLRLKQLAADLPMPDVKKKDKDLVANGSAGIEEAEHDSLVEAALNDNETA